MNRAFIVNSSTAILLLLAASGCSQHIAVTSESYPIDSGAVLNADTFNGDITVTWHDGDQMALEISRSSWKGEGELEKAEVTVTAGDTVWVEAVRTDNDANVGVDLEIGLPQGVRIRRILTSNGDIRIIGGAGEAYLDTSNGDVIVVDFEGTLIANTSNGDIDFTGGSLLGADTSNGDILAEIRSLPGDEVVLDTSNGDIVLYIADDINAELEMDTSLGNIVVAGLDLTDARISDTEGSATLGDGGAVIILDSSNGDIEVYPIGYTR